MIISPIEKQLHENISSLSLARTTLIWIAEAILVCYEINSEAVTQKIPCCGGFCELHPHEKFAAVVSRSGDCIQLIDLEAGKIRFEEKNEHQNFRQTAICFFGDYLLYSLFDGQINAYHLSTGQRLEWAHEKKDGEAMFQIEWFIPFDHEYLGIIGFQGKGEPSDLITVQFPKLLASGTTDFWEVRDDKPEYEMASTFTFAPHSGNPVLGYQDFDDEQLEEDEFNGVFHRTLPVHASEELSPFYRAEIATAAPMIRMGEHAAIAGRSHIYIVNCSSGALIKTIPCDHETQSFWKKPLVTMDHAGQQIAWIHQGKIQVIGNQELL